MPSCVLSALDLCKTYASRHEQRFAVDRVSLELWPGEAVALMGPSGCGKSTLLGLLSLRLRATSGELMLNGEPVVWQDHRNSAIRNRAFGIVSQDLAIIDYLSVAANVQIPLEYERPRRDGRERRQMVLNALARVDLDGMMHRKASALSVGERQRAAIARAVIMEPSVILADEPTSALDAANADQALALLLAIRETDGCALIATHDPTVADRCDRTIQMSYGKLLDL